VDDRRGIWVQFPERAEYFLQSIQTGFGAHPASYPIGIRGTFRGIKQPKREADQLVLRLIMSEAVGLHPPPMRLHGVMHRNKSTV
jgi:hypothetical protein